jgi:anti-anti-sigma regulatory factor
MSRNAERPGGGSSPARPTVRVLRRDGRRVVVVRGEVDLATAGSLLEQFAALADQLVGAFSLDVAHAFFDLVGLETLLRAVEGLPGADRPVPVLGASPTFRRVLAVADSDRRRLRIAGPAGR